MDIYLVQHQHRHGTSFYLIRADHLPTEDEAIRAHDIDFEEDRDEYLEIEKLCEDDIKELPPTTAT